MRFFLPTALAEPLVTLDDGLLLFRWQPRNSRRRRNRNLAGRQSGVFRTHTSRRCQRREGILRITKAASLKPEAPGSLNVGHSALLRLWARIAQHDSPEEAVSGPRLQACP
jgi:hypothetical protein